MEEENIKYTNKYITNTCMPFLLKIASQGSIIFLAEYLLGTFFRVFEFFSRPLFFFRRILGPKILLNSCKKLLSDSYHSIAITLLGALFYDQILNVFIPLEI